MSKTKINKPKNANVENMKKEVRRMANLFNKRIARLEKNNLQGSPAYKAYLNSGNLKFGVRGKSFNELQQEKARLQYLIDLKTSTVRGCISFMKQTALNTGITFESTREFQKKAPLFFKLAERVEEYLRTVKDCAAAIGYQKIWEAVNLYTKENNVTLEQANRDVEDILEEIEKVLGRIQPKQDLSWFDEDTFTDLPF